MTDQTETARELLWRHQLPEDVIDGALALHAQELAGKIRARFDGSIIDDVREQDADLISPEHWARREQAVPAPATDQAAPADRAVTLRELEQQQRPNTPPSRPDASPTPTSVKQRADCTELEWAVQERARFERLYTRETVRADLAEQRADTAARDADIYQKRLERLSDGYTEQRKRAEEAEARAEAMERAMESTAADASAHRFCHMRLMAQCQRAEQAEAEAERLRADRAAVLREAADAVAADTAFHIRYGSAIDYATRYANLLRRMADETQQPTPCGPAPSECDAEAGEPCANHEREQAHAEGEHCFCGPECEGVPS